MLDTIQAPRLSTYRLIDADGHFYCASDMMDCRRLNASACDGKGRVEENQHPIWVNHWHPDHHRYDGTPATIQYLYGHPITDEERYLVEAAQDQRDAW